MATGEADAQAPPWSPARRIGFRWLFVYVVLYMLQPSPLDWVAPALAAPYSALWERIVKAVGRHVLGLQITVLPNSSGDTTYNYVQVLCYAVLAGLVALAWTLADRRRQDYRRLHDWLRAAVRVYVAILMFLYGALKVVKTQFPDLSPVALHLPLGDLTPNALLWTFMGASTLYTFWTGLLEMVSGLLLVSRRTTLLGSLMCIGVMSNVVVLNLSYDVVVKLFSLHLLGFAVVLAAPDARRLLDLFVRNRPVPAAEIRPLFAEARRHRIVLALRTAGLVLVAVLLVARAVAFRRTQVEQSAGPRFYGAWGVEQLTVDGVTQPGAGDETSWRRVVFDGGGFNGRGHRAAVQLADGRWRKYQWQLAGRTLELGEGTEASPVAALQMRSPGPDRLELAGDVGRHELTMVLRREDPHFVLADREFRWIREEPRM